MDLEYLGISYIQGYFICSSVTMWDQMPSRSFLYAMVMTRPDCVAVFLFNLVAIFLHFPPVGFTVSINPFINFEQDSLT